jgi:hypothetical protein
VLLLPLISPSGQQKQWTFPQPGGAYRTATYWGTGELSLRIYKHLVIVLRFVEGIWGLVYSFCLPSALFVLCEISCQMRIIYHIIGIVAVEVRWM